jgi:hypothetical protein
MKLVTSSTSESDTLTSASNGPASMSPSMPAPQRYGVTVSCQRSASDGAGSAASALGPSPSTRPNSATRITARLRRSATARTSTYATNASANANTTLATGSLQIRSRVSCISGMGSQ